MLLLLVDPEKVKVPLGESLVTKQDLIYLFLFLFIWGIGFFVNHYVRKNKNRF
ncbi:hypothetical protein T190611E02C_40325 [Tenacibaculum sp. 190524A05c]